MLSIGSDNSSTTYSGVMQDNGYAGGTGGSLSKTGTGKVILSGVNTYTGVTTIAAGILQVDGSITSAPTINSGGTLSGHGSVGSITLTSGGFLAPGGSSYGTLQAASLLWDSGGQLQFTLGQATPDLLLISGELAKDSTSNGTYTFDFSNGGVQAGETFDLVKGTGGLSRTSSCPTSVIFPTINSRVHSAIARPTMPSPLPLIRLLLNHPRGRFCWEACFFLEPV